MEEGRRRGKTANLGLVGRSTRGLRIKGMGDKG